MMKIFKQVSALLFSLLMLNGWVWADEGPEPLIRATTEQLVVVIEANRHLYESDPEAFYESVEAVIEPVVAFDVMSRGVMGSYAKQANLEQQTLFSKAFQRSLVEFYGKALVVYNNEKIEVLPIKPEYLNKPRVPVEMVIHAANESYPLRYTMFNDQGAWKMRNVIVNGVNVGKVFRSQFAQAMQEYQDLQYVIEHWREIMQPTETAAVDTNK